MSTQASSLAVPRNPKRSILSYLLRCIIALNFFRFALSFWPRFEGTDKNVGIVDQLFSACRLGGFRIDFLWLIGSTLVVLFFILVFAIRARKDPSAKFDLILCIAWVASFAIYMVKLALSGLLDFG